MLRDMATVKCIVVDDDMFSTKIMTGYVDRTKDMTLVGCFTNAVEAINFLSGVEGNGVNLIFLDIEMPEMNGIEFMKAVDMSGKEVVIYSSQEKYAMESYEYDVCDYLLKPVRYVRFMKAVGKARKAISSREGFEDEMDGDGETIYLRDNKGAVYKVRFEDIALVETMENYVQVCTTRQKILVHTTMREMMERMPERYIVKAHRSYAVGLRHVCNLDRERCVVEVGTEKVTVAVSRTFIGELRKRLDAIVNDPDGGELCAVS